MNAALLISSCDAYSDCWQPMMHSLYSKWRSCPYPIYIISNRSDDSLLMSPKFIKVGIDRGWGANLALALQSVSSEFIIYLQEDYFIEQNVNSIEINKHIGYCNKFNIDYLRLSSPWQDNEIVNDMNFICQRSALTGTEKEFPESHHSLYRNDAFSHRYALCLQPAIWRTSVLKQLCQMVYSGWDFERKIKKIIIRNELNVRARVLHSSFYPEKGLKVVSGTAIRKGLWTRGGESYLTANGFDKLLEKRRVEGPLTDWLMRRNNFVSKVPAVITLRAMKLLKINF